jgi:hypothetical protein
MTALAIMSGRGPGKRTPDCQHGVACPQCKSRNTWVNDSRPREDGSTRRRRECGTCKFRFTTYEQLAEDAFTGPPPAELNRALRLLRDALDLVERWRPADGESDV